MTQDTNNPVVAKNATAQNNQEWLKRRFKEVACDVQDQWRTGGLAGTMYEDFAWEIYKIVSAEHMAKVSQQSREDALKEVGEDLKAHEETLVRIGENKKIIEGLSLARWVIAGGQAGRKASKLPLNNNS